MAAFLRQVANSMEQFGGTLLSEYDLKADDFWRDWHGLPPRLVGSSPYYGLVPNVTSGPRILQFKQIADKGGDQIGWMCDEHVDPREFVKQLERQFIDPDRYLDGQRVSHEYVSYSENGESAITRHCPPGGLPVTTIDQVHGKLRALRIESLPISMHLKVSIDRLLAEETPINYIEDDNGIIMSDERARDELRRRKEAGHKFVAYGSCEGFDPFETGCPGHLSTPEKPC